jgi:hypothetical protein
MIHRRKLAGLVLMGAAMLGTLGTGAGAAHATERAAPSTAGGPTPNVIDSYYEVRNVGTQGCLTVKDRSHAPGALVRQFNCLGNAAHQVWRLEFFPNSSVFMLRNRESFQCLDIQGSALLPPNRTRLIQNPCDATSLTQRWRDPFVGVRDGLGYYQLVADFSGKCIDLDDGSSGNDKLIQMWTCEGPGNDHQGWQFK